MNNERTKNGLLIGLLCGIVFLLVIVITLFFLILLKNNSDNETTEAATTEAATTEAATESTTESTTKQELPKSESEPLSDQELNEIQTMLNSFEYYGFRLSQYDDAKDIDWEQVLYCGAKIAEQNVTQEQLNAYMRQMHMDELYTDVTAVSGDNLEKFVNATAGYSYSEARRPLEWAYVQEYNLYFFMHGDTNYTECKCLSGEKKGDEYTILYDGYTESFEQAVLEIKFVKENDNYRFISNKIADQSNANSPQSNASPNGYSDDELCKLALDYYQRTYDYRPDISEVDSEENGMVMLHLYDDMGDHFATSAWLQVDRKTAKGINVITEETIDLIND